MKNRNRWGGLCFLWLAFSSLVLAAPDQERPSQGEAFLLQVRVTMPPNTDPWVEEDLSEAIVNRVRTLFLRKGFGGTVEEVRPRREPETGVPLLDLQLFEWQTTRTEMVRMTLRGDALNADGEKTKLGIFTSTDFLWSARNRFELAHAFRGVADDVAENIWNRIQKKGGWKALFASKTNEDPAA